uniref:Uncharacterized protein n=1 Tax=Nicotiana tabacum TaxID=4097 RepID=A0A1S3YIU2_TOBAC|nr:uncharacterized protein LOC104098035 [Nicotiana tomentosiformis]XP_016452171.1 PREDICTED: uncharacterized protein LOC107776766 [Nicotiana tabacum]
MEIQQLVLKFKFHILFASIFSIFIIILIYLAPRFIDVIKYFWPLLLSTALFLVAVVLFGRISPPVAEAEKPGEDILDFVAGQPDELQPHLHELHEHGEEEEGESSTSKVE